MNLLFCTTGNPCPDSEQCWVNDCVSECTPNTNC
jgi:hypothetical protein